jgi:predicted phosphodiesterase
MLSFMARLWALSDLHLGHAVNRAALADLAARPDEGDGPSRDDWLIVAGDVGETDDDFRLAWTTLCPRFEQIVWVPGNHDLWSPQRQLVPAGAAKYEHLVRLCREHGVLTPEDPYPLWPGAGPPTRLVPLFLLYDYSFAPDGMSPDEAKQWACEDGIECADERLLRPEPYPSIQDWCHARLAQTLPRLQALPASERTVLINHFPLRRDLVRLKRIPRFVPWCGTVATEDWHLRFRAEVVVSGHLHIRATDWRSGTRFEETSLGYPSQWQQDRGINAYLRLILPGPPPPEHGDGGPIWYA